MAQIPLNLTEHLVLRRWARKQQRQADTPQLERSNLKPYRFSDCPLNASQQLLWYSTLPKQSTELLHTSTSYAVALVSLGLAVMAVAWQWWRLLSAVLRLSDAIVSLLADSRGDLGARRRLGQQQQQQQQFGQGSWWHHSKLVVDAEIVKCQDRKIGLCLVISSQQRESLQTLETTAFKLTTATHKVSDCVYGWLHLEKMLVGVHTNSQELMI